MPGPDLHPFLSGPDEQCIYIDANTRIQIIDTMLILPTADKEQCAAFIVRLFFFPCRVPRPTPSSARRTRPHHLVRFPRPYYPYLQRL